MGLYERIDALCSAERARTPSRTSNKIILYAEGTKAKFRNADYALLIIQRLSTLSDEFADSTDSEFSIKEKLEFHVDSFFAFLYSSFDIISQVVNQKSRLGLNEKAVSFYKVKSALRSRHQGTSLQRAYERISRKNFFKNLDNYRNCSSHRRPICIMSTHSTATAGYSTSGSIPIPQHLICENPLSLNPRFRQRREVVEFCARVLRQSKQEIEKIITIL